MILFIVILVLGIPICAASAGDSPPTPDVVTVDGILEQYVEASGGDALAGIKTEVRKGTLLRGLTGQIPLETAAIAPGRWRYNQTFAWGDQVSYICDGTSGWTVDTKGVSPMDPSQMADLRLVLDVQAPLRLREFYPEMSIKGMEGKGIGEATVILARSRDGLVTELAFDRATGLLVRAGGMRFEDYRDAGPIKRPFRVRLGESQGESHLQMVMQFAEIVHGTEVEEGLFGQPACPLAFKDPPLYKRRTRVQVGAPALEACVGIYQHPTDSTVTYTVTRQANHLMIERTGWGTKFEIVPESETDYFMEFLNREFHFVRNETGAICRLEIGTDRSLKAPRVE